MLLAMTERETLVTFFPPGGIGAEIGVAAGDFAQVMLDGIKPQRLHLIDPWSHSEASAIEGRAHLDGLKAGPRQFGPPAHNPPGEIQYDAIRQRFALRPEVDIIRQFSYKASALFKDGYFDFVYLDGDHTYEYVSQDLFDFAPKIKNDGLIFGHDFFEDEFAKASNYGVIDAVHRFIRRTGFQLICLTYEPFSTFVIAKTLTGYTERFLKNLLESDVFLIEMSQEQAFRYSDKKYIRENGMARRIPSFI